MLKFSEHAAHKDDHQMEAVQKSEPVISEAATEVSSTKKLNSRLVWALAAGTLWLSALGILAYTTANPATMNRVQILQADVIFTGTILDPQQGTVEVQKILGARQLRNPWAAKQVVTLRPINPQWRAQQSRIFPVRQTDVAAGEIVPAPLPKSRYLDYPVEAASEQELQKILTQH